MSELFKLKNGTVLISTEAPGGIYNSAQLKKIAELCSKELAIVKATEDQRLSLFVKESEVERVTQELKTTGLGFRNYQSGLHQPVSCLGELCETHDQPALTTAMDLTKLLADLKLLSPLKIGINGCARCCTPCHTLDVSVVGEPSGYRISLGGKPSQFPELASFFAESVPSEKLPKLLTKVIEIFQSKAEPGETLSEVLDRCGVEDFVTALAPYSQDAAHRDDPFAVPEISSDSQDDFSEINGEAMEMAPDSLSEDVETLPIEDVSDLEITDLTPASDEMMELEFEEPLTGATDDMDYELSSQDSGANDSLEEVRINTDQSQALDDDIVLGNSEMIDDSDILLDESITEVPELDAMVADAEAMDEILDDITDTPEILPPSLLDDSDAESSEIESEAAEIKAALKADSDIHLSDSPEEEMVELEFEDSEAMTVADEPLDDEAMLDVTLEEPELLDIEESLELSIDEDGSLEADVPLLSDETSELPELDENLLSTEATKVNSDSDSTLEEGDGEAEGEMMSSEDELDFEEKIQASIEEEKKMRKHIEEDTNLSAREDTLRMLESASERASTPSAAFNPAPSAIQAKSSASAPRAFEFEGIDVTESILRVYFSSSAYLDFNLETLDVSRSKVLRMGKQAITVTHERDGYTLEVDGMKMFYPKENLRAAS